MKKKIIIILGLITVLFLLGGIYIISSIEKVTSRLDNLVTLYQIEILREHLLIEIKKVQNDLSVKNTRYAKSADTVIDNFRNMEQIADTCFDCHHSEKVLNRLKSLRTQVNEYKDALGRVLTISANQSRLEVEEDNAYRIGADIIEQVNGMIVTTNAKLENKTQSTLQKISEAKIILYILIAAGPFLILGLGFIFVRNFTGPINTLLEATRKLKAGDLDYRINGLKDEFGEVAASFNEMSNSLREHMLKIQDSEKRYRMLFESAGDAIFILEAEGENAGKIVSANLAAAEMHGYTTDEMLKLSMVKDLDTPDAAQDAPGRIERIKNGEWIKAEIEHRKKDGTVFPIEMSAGLFEFTGHQYILAFDRDITERKKSEEAIIRSYNIFTTVLDSIDALIYVADLETYEILYINDYARNVFGDLVGKICWQTLQSGQNKPCDFCTNDKLLTPGGKPAGVYHWEFQNTVNGRWYDISDRVIEWIDGHLVRMEIATDITERKKIDETLKRAEQMKLVGEWAVGLTHEIKNSLAGIKISVEVLLEELSVSEEDKATILKAVDEIKRIESLLKSLLTFAKPPKLQLVAVNVNEMLNKTIDSSLEQFILASNTTAKIDVVKDLNSNIPNTMVDPLLLQQAFKNIVLNSGEAMRDGGTITVKTSYDAGSDVIKIEISDNGPGIDEKILNKIFDPFFTTKSKGAGVGLAITKRIVEQHRGEISVGNRPGGGVIYSISLPVKQPLEEEQ